MSNLECFECNNPIREDDDYVQFGSGYMHTECHEECEKFLDAFEAAEQEANRRIHKKNNRIMRHLHRTLKRKILKPIELAQREHFCDHLEIVTIKEVKGKRQRSLEFFGESTAIRHVYDDTSSCSYSGSYGGEVFIYIGKQRYLKMHIWG